MKILLLGKNGQVGWELQRALAPLGELVALDFDSIGPLKADFALVRAWKGDTRGNLVYRKTARNFHPMMATAARVTLAEVEHLVAPGEIEPDAVHTPGIFVQHILQGVSYERRVEKRTVRAANG